MAAACLFHINRNHPFIDGNKRTGAAAVFLLMNGIEPLFGERDFERIVRPVAEGRKGKTEVAAFFRKNCTK